MGYEIVLKMWKNRIENFQKYWHYIELLQGIQKHFYQSIYGMQRFYQMGYDFFTAVEKRVENFQKYWNW